MTVNFPEDCLWSRSEAQGLLSSDQVSDLLSFLVDTGDHKKSSTDTNLSSLLFFKGKDLGKFDNNAWNGSLCIFLVSENQAQPGRQNGGVGVKECGASLHLQASTASSMLWEGLLETETSDA